MTDRNGTDQPGEPTPSGEPTRHYEDVVPPAAPGGEPTVPAQEPVPGGPTEPPGDEPSGPGGPGGPGEPGEPSGGGGQAWWWILGAIVLAVLLYFLFFNDGDDDGDGTTTTGAVGATSTSAPSEEPTTTAATATSTSAAPDGSTTSVVTGEAVVVCLVTDLAGVDDRSFNAAAWQGVLDAVEAGVAAPDPLLLESDEQADYQPNIDQCLEQGAQHVVTVGFELGDATASNAEANPEVLWTIVDFAYDPEISNVRGLVYQTDEAAFGAGYLAAGMSQSGVVGTYGGLNIPPVSIFMDGLARGVAHYNEVNGADVSVLGWDVAAQDGTFTGTFDPADPTVRSTCETLLDEGADIILPVGGAINLPCGTAIQDRGIDAALIGVDQDAFLAAPAEYQDLWLTTIEKGITIQVTRSITDHANGSWTSGVSVGNLENGGVGLAPFHSWEDRVPPELAAEVDQILADIAAGTLSITD